MCLFKDGTRAALLKRRLGYGNRPRMSFRGAKRRGNPLNRNANLNGVLPRASLVLAISTAQKIFAISSSRDKNSCHNFARLSAWCWRASTQADKRTLIQSVLIHGMCNFKDGTRAALLKRRLGYGNRPRMSFRGAKRRGNPLNRNENTVAIATDLACFRNYYRATTLHSQKERD